MKGLLAEFGGGHGWLAPIAVSAAMAGIGLRPTWVSVGAFLIAVAFYAVERFAEALTARAEASQDYAAGVEKYVVEIEELRSQIKLVSDGLKQTNTNLNMSKRSVF